MHLWVWEYEVKENLHVIFQLHYNFTFEEKCELARDDTEICFRQSWMKYNALDEQIAIFFSKIHKYLHEIYLNVR